MHSMHTSLTLQTAAAAPIMERRATMQPSRQSNHVDKTYHIKIKIKMHSIESIELMFLSNKRRRYFIHCRHHHHKHQQPTTIDRHCRIHLRPELARIHLIINW